MARMVNTFEMEDCYRALYPSGTAFSRYYDTQGPGHSRIDRCYSWGPSLSVTEAEYLPVSFSDHMGHIVTFSLAAPQSRLLSPRARPIFKIRPEVIKEQLSLAMKDWLEVRGPGVDVMTWWDEMVKKGIRRIAINRGKEMNRERRGHLNLLFLRQSYHARRLHSGELNALTDLLSVQKEIEEWYETECSKVILQSRSDECASSEKVRIYHHELHRKKTKRSSILPWMTEEGLLEGHSECSYFLERQVEDLLLTKHPVDQDARDTLLSEVDSVFSVKDHELLCAPPTNTELKLVLSNSHLLAAPGIEGIYEGHLLNLRTKLCNLVA